MTGSAREGKRLLYPPLPSPPTVDPRERGRTSDGICEGGEEVAGSAPPVAADAAITKTATTDHFAGEPQDAQIQVL